jgi:hypothetical protein
MDHQALGLQPADRLPHGQGADLELLGQRVDDHAVAGPIRTAQDPLADRLVDALLLGHPNAVGGRWRASLAATRGRGAGLGAGRRPLAHRTITLRNGLRRSDDVARMSPTR